MNLLNGHRPIVNDDFLFVLLIIFRVLKFGRGLAMENLICRCLVDENWLAEGGLIVVIIFCVHEISQISRSIDLLQKDCVLSQELGGIYSICSSWRERIRDREKNDL